jgi:beta-lactamase regulating signal transducer with metallopeptidase domain
MASELLSLLLWANATLSVGILIVLALRVPVRRLAGARIAYALWLLPLFAFLAWLVPARQVTVAVPQTAAADMGQDAMAAATSVSPDLLMIACWLAGVGAMLATFALRQRGFVRSAGSLEPIAELGHGVFRAAPAHGPAVVGAWRPKIVLPQDFGARFTAEEQALVLAHERTHLDRFDPMVNAAAIGLRAVNWFNPLVHMAARALRIDQELACDAAVLARHTGMRRVYAEAMLKSHAAAFDIPVGCAWHTAAFHPLKERILMLTFSPSRLSRGLGLSFVAAAALGVCGAVWLMRPVDVLAAPTRDEPVWSIEDEADAEADIAREEAQAALKEAMREARAAAREAMREGQAATDMAKREARAAALEAVREAQAAIVAARREAAAQARLAMRDARAAVAAARLAMRDAAPAIAAAERAIQDARPAIEAAQRDAERSLRQTKAWAAACQRAKARWPNLDLSDEGDLRVLEKLVCIPGHSKGVAPAPKPAPQQ